MSKGYGNEFRQLRFALEKLGWKSLDKGREQAAQGVTYANFQKSGKAIRLEYGDEDCVFGEVV